MWVLQLTWRSAGALPAPRIQSYKHIAPPELGQVSQDCPLAPAELHVYRQRLHTKRPRSVRSDMWVLQIHGAPLERSPHREFKAIDI